MKSKAYIFLLILSLIACSKPTNVQLASERLEQARHLVAKNMLNQAKIEIDSIHVLFPEQVAVRRSAQDLSDSIFCLEAKRNLAYADSVLKMLENQYDELSSKFVYVNKGKYEDQGRFVHRTFRSISEDQTQITAQIFDDGEVLVRSLWAGNQLSHERLTLRCNGLERSAVGQLHTTAKLSRRRNDVSIEILSITGGQAAELLQFADLNVNSNILAVLSGEDQAVYWVNAQVVKALSETYRMSVLVRDMFRAEKQINSSRAILERYGN